MPTPEPSLDALNRAVAAASALALPPVRPGALCTVVPLGPVVSVAPGPGPDAVISLAKLAERGADPARCICVTACAGWVPGGYIDGPFEEIVVETPAVPGAPLVYVGTLAELAPNGAPAPPSPLALLDDAIASFSPRR